MTVFEAVSRSSVTFVLLASRASFVSFSFTFNQLASSYRLSEAYWRDPKLKTRDCVRCPEWCLLLHLLLNAAWNADSAVETLTNLPDLHSSPGRKSEEFSLSLSHLSDNSPRYSAIVFDSPHFSRAQTRSVSGSMLDRRQENRQVAGERTPRRLRCGTNKGGYWEKREKERERKRERERERSWFDGESGFV